LSALTIPWCTYTDPEIAHVGLYVRQARERDIPVDTFTIPMHDVDRAIADDEEVGFVKITVKERTDRILGATIVRPARGRDDQRGHAGDRSAVGLRTLARVIHPYPTQAEAIKKAADACTRAGARSRVRQLAGRPER
jgi:pyruvate/2-oxoglutarate dehydrogenase complex dihydrolipoamide dehydrogenase (E3) component